MTQIVRSWVEVAGPNYGIELSSSEDGSAGFKQFWSSLPPTLTVTLSPYQALGFFYTGGWIDPNTDGGRCPLSSLFG